MLISKYDNIMSSKLEYLVNNWLDKTITSNNGIILLNYNNEIYNYTYRDYCNHFYSKISDLVRKNNHDIINEEEFKDRVIYFLYKYCQNE